MRINNTIQLDYSDVLIKPSKSQVYSRNDVNLVRKFYFPASKQSWEGIPIIAANMDTIGTYEVYQQLSKHKIITCFHKFYNPEDFESMELDPNYFMISTGINENDLIRLQAIIEKIEVKFICIDVANGYMESLIEFCRKIRELYPNKIIIAGNIVCENRTKELIKHGKVDIVKVGIGSGCFDENTKILLANGTYEKISNIKEGTKVINKDGKQVKVIRSICKGMREVIKIIHSRNYEPTIVTPDHKYWIADLSKSTLATIKKNALYKLTKPKKKYTWEEIGKIDIQKQFMCFPRKIDWDLPEILKLDLMEVNNNLNIHYDEHFITINNQKFNRYLLFDENFGLIIGNYLRNLNDIENITNYINEFKIHEILQTSEILIQNFLDSLNTEVVSKYLNKNIDFIKGLYKGLVNFNEEQFNEERHYISIETHLFDLICFCLFTFEYDYIVNKFVTKNKNKLIIYKKNNYTNYNVGRFVTKKETIKKKKIKKRKTKSNENNESVNKNSEENQENENSEENQENENSEENQTNENSEYNEENESKQPKYVNTYDLEIDSECHSFIANNSIVHNSACLTRTQTGIGVPQLSAIDECATQAHNLNSYVIGDGGITCAGDIAKGFGACADFIMIGGLFSGHDENPGEIIEENNKKYKIFYGMSSKTSMEKNYGKMDTYRSSEGRSCKIPYKGSIENTLNDLLGGLRSTCTYVGANNIKELPNKCNFIRVNNQLNKMYEKFSD